MDIQIHVFETIIKFNFVPGDILCSCPPFECTCAHIRFQERQPMIESPHLTFSVPPSSWAPQIYEATPSPWQRTSAVDTNTGQSMLFQRHNFEVQDMSAMLLEDQPPIPAIPSLLVSRNQSDNFNFPRPAFDQSRYREITSCEGQRYSMDYGHKQQSRFNRPTELRDIFGNSGSCDREKPIADVQPFRIKSETNDISVCEQDNSSSFSKQACLRNSPAMSGSLSSSLQDISTNKLCDEFVCLQGLDTNSLLNTYTGENNDLDIFQTYVPTKETIESEQSSQSCQMGVSSGPKYAELKPLRKADSRGRRGSGPIYPCISQNSNAPYLLPESTVSDFLAGGRGDSRNYGLDGTHHSRFHNDGHTCSSSGACSSGKSFCNHSINITLTYN